MNRRDFILKTLKISSAMLVGTGLSEVASSLLNLDKNICQAYDYTLFSSDLPIVENHFSFRSLNLRSSTNKIIVHHSAIGGSDDVTAADIHRIHLQNGWSGIGYHMFIRKSGLVETGRPLEDVGAHTYQYNSNSIGICLSGNFNEENPTDAQLTSAKKLISLLCQMYSLSPNEHTIFGHRDFNATACPGDNLYADLPSFREFAGNNI